MDGIHDLGGLEGFGPVPYRTGEPVFHHSWEGRVFALMLLAGAPNIDAFRHAIERVDPVTYLTAGYYGRWLAALERSVAEKPATSGTRSQAGSRRAVGYAPRFRVGQPVLVKEVRTPGHTRCPGYVRRRRGVVEIVHPAWVFPDTNAHGLGERPQYVYCVGFDGRELWGDGAEPGARFHIDLFESYLDAVA